jgi:hypothetical protein
MAWRSQAAKPLNLASPFEAGIQYCDLQPSSFRLCISIWVSCRELSVGMSFLSGTAGARGAALALSYPSQPSLSQIECLNFPSFLAPNSFPSCTSLVTDDSYGEIYMPTRCSLCDTASAGDTSGDRLPATT